MIHLNTGVTGNAIINTGISTVHSVHTLLVVLGMIHLNIGVTGNAIINTGISTVHSVHTLLVVLGMIHLNTGMRQVMLSLIQVYQQSTQSTHCWLYLG